MTVTMYLVRHGQTLFNRRELVQGWVDSPLTDLGLAQARSAAEQLRHRPLVGLYSSTSERAGDTAEIIAEHHPGIALVRTKALKELHFGDLEATPNATFESGPDVRRLFAEVLAGSDTGFPGGESGRVYRDRVTSAIEMILSGHPQGGEVAVASHGVTIATVLVRAGWRSPGPLGNGSISIVRFGADGPQLVGVGLRDISGSV
jgi:2,3-bisphosphoglycerate-dependent phosphoglycerate mutase